ncbi:MAG: methylenetetrahydrofolate reductase [NAD(P)H] [Proteiniphilum sp.]|jgi:methylenetetrahydrofolate reductase (NADPH)|uniref:methylenetetrahydrofolate reductase [NAD(P)H] n=1 Tax=Syntrophomonas wolfei TaxID=863 RepID=UPI0023F3284E|nr:methylenetetrahydrofolate reductase [NAD(P)H] [Syntrophomonas wolfei]MDD3910313.1 methylenetetrahydrofolate reductase [NAD(P)H] [Proteiniphilum sp.]MDD4417100.1 methylenetetrahydrofolate reductase [NAD(P)H] [Proteiniphilum sp.]
MRTSEIFNNKIVLSLEIFPPRRTASIGIIYKTLEELQGLNPDFISVTYGAGGSETNTATLEIASAIKNNYGIESVAHLPCINLNKDEVLNMLEGFKQAGVENILALRGDVNPALVPKQDFRYASDLVSFIKENGDFNIIGACYPEGHSESSSLLDDIRNLKIKVDAGTDQLITQLFFDNSYFYSFRERASVAGINVPIEAGIMPVVNKRQIERMVSLCGVKLPKKFVTMMERYENNPEAMRDAGIAYAVDQIVDLIAQGVDGIHLYTMNNSYIAKKIYAAISTLLVA